MNFYFLYFEETKKLFKIFNEHNIEARFVGGCVRDAICNLVTDDFDIAVNSNIENLCNILNKYHINVIKTGIKFSSVTVIINNKKYEITSLRKDINCSGRHCDTENISSFEMDSNRRDFTINALYVSENGKIFDYHNGISDLQNNTIKFIGKPKTRIEEDFLRIFRYYRFCAKYNDYSNMYSEIIRNESQNINKLSIERIQREIFKILEIPNHYIIVRNMLHDNILKNINIEEYDKLLQINNKAHLSLKLYILFQYDYLINGFKLPKYLRNKIKLYKQFEDEPLIYCAYKNSIEIQEDIILIKHLKYNKPIINPILNIQNNKFPISYNDLPECIKKQAFKYLKECEKWWIINNFTPTKQKCLDFIKRNIKHE